MPGPNVHTDERLSRDVASEGDELKRRTAAPRADEASECTGESPPKDAPLGITALTTADVVKQHGTPVCSTGLALADAAVLLLSSDRTAAAVFDDDGEVRGVLSESDILAAYIDGAPWTQPVAEWLQRKGARVPAEVKAVVPDMSLSEAAAVMLQTAALCGGARQHLLVEGTDGKYHGILSALDLARTICGSGDFDPKDGDTEVSVSQVMRSKGMLPTCSLRCTIKQVLYALAASRQGAVLVADAKGVHGIVTPRDAVRAFASRIPSSEVVLSHATGLLGIQQVRFERRIIYGNTPAWLAAAAMAQRGVHHLVVVRPGDTEVVGVVSALDLARCFGGACAALVAPARGPEAHLQVTDAVDRRWAPVCSADSSLGDVCDEMMSFGRSSAVVLGEDGEPLGLLTENDFLRAYVGQTTWKTQVNEWLQSHAARCPPHVLLEHSVQRNAMLTEAAAQMAACAQGSYSGHHLLVRKEGALPATVLSSLDVARSLCEFDADKCTTQAQTLVRDAMKTKDMLPVIDSECSLRRSFDALLSSFQNCVLVTAEDGSILGMVTPRDVLRAFAEHVDGSTTVGRWLHGVGTGLQMRVITADARLADAAEAMAAGSVHHLLVVEAGHIGVVGVLSSLDIVCRLASKQEDDKKAVPVQRNWHVVAELMPEQ